MYAGFSPLPLAPKAAPIDEATHDACSGWTMAPPIQQARLSYPALCHLLHVSKTPSVRFGIFGRLYGAQIGNTVEVGNVCMNPPRERITERETKEEQARRVAQEQQRQVQSFERYESLWESEFFDGYQVGVFVISSATFNVFTSPVIKQITDLITSSQPGVLITYDPFRTTLLGKPYLKAYTLTEEYVAYATALREKRAVEKNAPATLWSRLMREHGVTRTGVLREVPLSLDVDVFHQLGLEHVDATPTIDSFAAVHSDGVLNYVEALLSNIQENTVRLTKQLDSEVKMSEKERNSGGGAAPQPLGQMEDTQLSLFTLKEQTQHLEALCDSILLNSSILRDL